MYLYTYYVYNIAIILLKGRFIINIDKELRLAVLIDAENISGKYIDIILSEANKYGNIIYKRIYGDWTARQMRSWKSVILDNALTTIQQYCNSIGKNSSDSALIIDAMDLLYQSNLDGFCIVSSDSDFTRLASRMRESDKFILGMGESKTPRSFISACHRFLYLDVLFTEQMNQLQPNTTERTNTSKVKNSGSKAPAPVQEEAPSGKDIHAVTRAMLRLAEENSGDQGRISAGKLGQLLNKMFSDFDPRNFGARGFVSFVESLDIFDVDIVVDQRDPSIRHYFFCISKQKKK